MERRVAIKEYFPESLASREFNGTTVVADGDYESYTWGLTRFLDEARTLARFKNLHDVISQFRNQADKKELVGHRSTPTGESLYLARPIRITNEGCLVCHSVPANALPAMVAKYGTANGFG